MTETTLNTVAGAVLAQTMMPQARLEAAHSTLAVVVEGAVD
jgi:hypothetical protein